MFLKNYTIQQEMLGWRLKHVRVYRAQSLTTKKIVIIAVSNLEKSEIHHHSIVVHHEMKTLAARIRLASAFNDPLDSFLSKNETLVVVYPWPWILDEEERTTNIVPLDHDDFDDEHAVVFVNIHPDSVDEQTRVATDDEMVPALEHRNIPEITVAQEPHPKSLTDQQDAASPPINNRNIIIPYRLHRFDLAINFVIGLAVGVFLTNVLRSC